MLSVSEKPRGITLSYPQGVDIARAEQGGAAVPHLQLQLGQIMMSLVAYLLHKLFGKKNELPSTGILIVANVIAALLFAAGHLPANGSSLPRGANCASGSSNFGG